VWHQEFAITAETVARGDLIARTIAIAMAPRPDPRHPISMKRGMASETGLPDQCISIASASIRPTSIFREPSGSCH
jgi:hypothetical protein